MSHETVSHPERKFMTLSPDPVLSSAEHQIRGGRVLRNKDRLFPKKVKNDALAKTRHTRGLCAEALAKEQNGYPRFRKTVEIPGFPFSRE